jgi:tripartite motif-containing protein 71
MWPIPVFRTPSPFQLNMEGVNIVRLAPSGRQLGLIHISSADARTGIAVDAQENSYIAYGTTPHLEKYSVGGALVATWGAPKPAFDAADPSPAGLTLDGAGNLYVASTPQNVIAKFGPHGTLLGSWGFPGSYAGQFHEPSGIAVDRAGTIYLADSGDHRIQRLSR